jgi:hypothetical protein
VQVFFLLVDAGDTTEGVGVLWVEAASSRHRRTYPIPEYRISKTALFLLSLVLFYPGEKRSGL